MQLFFERALLPGGIARNVRVSVAAPGVLTAVEANSTAGDDPVIRGLAVPGMPNLHSHAFQRAMAGKAESGGGSEDSFWTWRELMYRFVERLEPEDVAAIAAFAYLEMIEAGYTSVAEFHYLHRQPNGTPYADPAAMAKATRAGASRAGIRHVLLPCLYQNSGFGGQPPTARQRRFCQDTDSFLRLFESLDRCDSSTQTTGIALHSLRAITPDVLRTVVAGVRAARPAVPIHIHIAEQPKEVAECLAWSGQRPIELLLDMEIVDAHWCLVHATHATPAELHAIAQTQAIAGLCLTTEANLGDGLFPCDSLVAAGGRFGIGTDSQVSIDPREELRTIEYTLRLWRQRRILSASPDTPNCGTFLYSASADGGAQALGLPAGAIASGAPADIVVIDTDRPEFAGVAATELLDAYVFAPRPGQLRDVLVGGTWVLRDGRHPARESIAADYANCLRRLLGA